MRITCLTTSLIFFGLVSFVDAVATEYEATEEDFVRWENAWDRLIPAGTYDFVPQDFGYELLFNPTFQSQLDAAGRVIDTALEGQRIELAGFMVPIEVKGQSVSQFLLVPEAGQCIHVPPPPLNQTLLVDATNAPTELRDLYEPVIVSGRLSVITQRFEIAESGYTLVDVTVTTLDLGEEMIPIAPGADGDR
ncbi:MAG: DUF3299 domain-containing protein [Litorivicinaceae bacterium]|jgi:hypothetical protein|nr:DUF3299 domain-containing protein [Litorivicinus sp.]RZO82338.1 MAG: DUF3299 domain-containing protein [Litorivicinaceae bacterium]|tara:strand:+ start:282 stop:857 length:576 start_codon:yes stop_codon:yes gene_type:complete